jgi:hypothetical protein
MNSHIIDRINNKPQYKNQDFLKDTPLRRKYYAEHQQAFSNELQKAADKLGTDASGKHHYVVAESTDGSWSVVVSEVKHAATTEKIKVHVAYGPKGYIKGVKILGPETMTHSDISIDFLKHSGAGVPVTVLIAEGNKKIQEILSKK